MLSSHSALPASRTNYPKTLCRHISPSQTSFITPDLRPAPCRWLIFCQTQMTFSHKICFESPAEKGFFLSLSLTLLCGKRINHQSSLGLAQATTTTTQHNQICSQKNEGKKTLRELEISDMSTGDQTSHRRICSKGLAMILTLKYPVQLIACFNKWSTVRREILNKL